MKITLTSFSFALMVFSLSLSSVQCSKPLLAGILKAPCSVLPLILNAALPVRAVLTTLTSSEFSPEILFRNLIRTTYNAFTTVLLPTPAPPPKGARSRYFRLFCFILLIMSSKRQIDRARVLPLKNHDHITSENDFPAV